MPELPEVESVRLALLPLIGERVRSVRVDRRDVVRDAAGQRRGPLDPINLLVGDRVAALERRGKQLAIVADSGRVMLVHLGMSGQLLLNPGDTPPDHRHASWVLGKSTTLVFRDPRRFGGLWLLPDRAALYARWEALGIDGLAVTGPDLLAAIGHSTRPVKAALLDQATVAGVGNIYADESLFDARIAPTRRCNRVRDSEWDRLAASIRTTLAQAVRAGGSTLRDYRRPDGSPGEATRTHRVYGQWGSACPECGGTIHRTTLAQRTTCWCPTCQK